MKRFLAIILILALILPAFSYAEGESPSPSTTETAPPSPAPPAPTPEPTPTPTPIVDRLRIDGYNLYPGMIKTYAQGYVPLVQDDAAYIVLPLIGQAYDGIVTVTANLGQTADSPFVYGNYSQTLSGWGVYVFCFEIPLIKGRLNGSYPITFTANYLDVLGKMASDTFSVYVTITDGRNPPDPNDIPKEPAEKPELFISSCTLEPDAVTGGEEFTVTVSIDNIGNIRARSVKLSFGSTAEGILPAGTDNAILLDNIASEGSATASFKLKTTKDVLAGNQSFFVNLDYVDLYGGTYSSQRQFLISVTQPVEMSWDAISVPKEITAGETIALPANVFNVGKATLRNVSVTIEGAGLFPVSTVFLGDIAPSQASYGEMKVFIGMLSMSEGYSESYGKTSGRYTVTYYDDAGRAYTAEQTFSTEIKQPVIEADKSQAEKEAAKPVIQWWVAAMVGLAAIAIIVAVIIISKFSRMLKMR